MLAALPLIYQIAAFAFAHASQIGAVISVAKEVAPGLIKLGQAAAPLVQDWVGKSGTTSEKVEGIVQSWMPGATPMNAEQKAELDAAWAGWMDRASRVDNTGRNEQNSSFPQG